MLRSKMTIWLNYLLVLFAFIFPLSAKRTSGLMVLIVFLWFFEGEWHRKLDVLKKSVPLRWFLLFFAFLGLSILWSDTLYGGFVKHYPQNAFIAYIKMYALYVMLVPIMLTSLQPKFFRWMLSAFLGAMFVSEMASWGLFLGLLHISGRIPNDPSPFMHHSLYSIFLSMTIFILATLFLKSHSFGQKIFMGFFIMSAITNLFLNGGRLGQVAFFIALIFYIFIFYRASLKSIVLSVVIIISIFTGAYFSSPIFHQRVHTSIISVKKIFEGDYRTSWGNRVLALIISKDIVKEHPLIGVGIGGAKKSFMEQAESYKDGLIVKDFWHMHNQYVQILLETGLIGMSIFMIFLYIMFRLTLDQYNKALLIAFLVIYLIGFVGEPLFWNRQPFLLFNFMVAYFIITAANLKEKPCESTYEKTV